MTFFHAFDLSSPEVLTCDSHYMYRVYKVCRTEIIKFAEVRIVSLMTFSIIHGCEMHTSLQSSRKSLPSHLLLQLTWLFSTGYDISRRHLYKPVMLDYVQIRCLLSRCTGATSVHQVSQQIGHGNVDMGRSWRVSIESLFFLYISSFFLLIFIHLFFIRFIRCRLKLLWLTLTQLNSSCEIEFLPVYNPSEAEKLDPKLYANNVRRLMAEWVFRVQRIRSPKSIWIPEKIIFLILQSVKNSCFWLHIRWLPNHQKSSSTTPSACI